MVQNSFFGSEFFFWFEFFFRFNLGSGSWLRPTHRQGPSGDPEIVQKVEKPRTRLHFGAGSGVIFGTQGIFFDLKSGHAAPNEKRIPDPASVQNSCLVQNSFFRSILFDSFPARLGRVQKVESKRFLIRNGGFE